jgi:hypothetical protein
MWEKVSYRKKVQERQKEPETSLILYKQGVKIIKRRRARHNSAHLQSHHLGSRGRR